MILYNHNYKTRFFRLQGKRLIVDLTKKQLIKLSTETLINEVVERDSILL